MPNAIVLLADGFETAEALTVVDVLRRAGIRTRTISVMDTRQVISAQQVQVGVDDNLITARDLASAPAFSLMIVQMLAGEQAARKTSAGIGTPLPSLS